MGADESTASRRSIRDCSGRGAARSRRFAATSARPALEPVGDATARFEVDSAR